MDDCCKSLSAATMARHQPWIFMNSYAGIVDVQREINY